MKDTYTDFFSSPAFAVLGASSQRHKFGNKVLRCYLQHHKKVYPVNPNEKIVEGIACVRSLSELPDEVKSISVITPPPITEKLVEQAIAKGIKHIWMQPGAENEKAIANAKAHGISVIANGPCILVHLGFKEES